MKRALTGRLNKEIPAEAVTVSCAKEGCRVSLKDAPSPHWVIDMDHSFFGLANKPHCDFLFIGWDGNRKVDWIVPLELKKGSVDAAGLEKQLKAGSAFAEEWIAAKRKVQFLPVGVYGGKLKPRQRDLLRRSRISFHGKKYELKLIRCNSRLTKAFGS